MNRGEALKFKILLKFFCIFLLYIIIVGFENKCFGISNDFKFVINTIGIPQYNVYGEEINEDIYYTYNIFAYSNPLLMYSKTNTQRFKAVPDNGKWTENGGVYRGVGVRGEYYVLGTSYSGFLIDNVYFPVDAIPETTPDNWRYISFAGAYESWFDTNKYKYIDQLDYMKNTNLLFDKLDYVNNVANSYNLVEYNIKPINIGLDKMRLNTCSTWKTMGVISAKRINNKGQIRNAIFATKPMSANANIKSKLIVDNYVEISENLDNKNILISFGANAINLTTYAKKEHIKEIVSILYIDGKEVAKSINSKVIELNKQISFNINRENFKNNQTLHLEIVSYMYTEFSVDGLMKDSVKKDITIQIDPKKVVPVKDLDIKILENKKNKYFVKSFIKTNISESEKSYGIVEAGRKIALKLVLEDGIDKLDTIELYLNGKREYLKILDSDQINLNTEEVKNKAFVYFSIDEKLKNTIASWNYLRNESNNYFEIDFKEIGKRVNKPNIFKIVAKTLNNDVFEKEILIDTIDSYQINMNYIFDNGVLNKNEIEQEEKIEDWIIK